jgi:hypothetical protein
VVPPQHIVAVVEEVTVREKRRRQALDLDSVLRLAQSFISQLKPRLRPG